MSRIDVPKISEDITKELEDKIKSLDKKPTLAIILVGDDPASVKYVKSKGETMAKMGVGYKDFILPEDTTEEEVLKLVEELNNDDTVHGMLVQLPIPNPEIDDEKVVSAVSPLKDVDGFNEGGAPPCTALGIMKILERTNYEVKGKKVAVIGNNITVAKPSVDLLNQAGAEVLNIDSEDSSEIKAKLAEFQPQAIVSGVDKVGLISSSDIPDSVEVLIDGGAVREKQEDGKYKTFGDFNADEYELLDERGIDYTFRVKGVGIMILTMLVYNLLDRYELLNKSK